jgi:translation initiation factor 6
MQFLKTSFNGDQNVGLYGFATNSYCLLGFEPNSAKKISDTLGVKVVPVSIAETVFAGIFVAGNSNGIVVPKTTEDYEIKRLKELLGINVQVIETDHTALGNLVLCNDNGCIISNLLRKYKKAISDALGVEVQVGTLAKETIVGSAGRVTNNGCLCHRDSKDLEMKEIENILKVKSGVGTINFGTPFIKAGIIVNSKGMVVSEKSTGPELDRCFEVFE